jgi:hypothetical protein
MKTKKERFGVKRQKPAHRDVHVKQHLIENINLPNTL